MFQYKNKLPKDYNNRWDGQEFNNFLRVEINVNILPLGEEMKLSLSLSFSLCVCGRVFYVIYNRLSLSRNGRGPQKQFEISVLRHIRFVVLRKRTI